MADKHRKRDNPKRLRELRVADIPEGYRLFGGFLRELRKECGIGLRSLGTLINNEEIPYYSATTLSNLFLSPFEKGIGFQKAVEGKEPYACILVAYFSYLRKKGRGQQLGNEALRLHLPLSLIELMQ